MVGKIHGVTVCRWSVIRVSSPEFKGAPVIRGCPEFKGGQGRELLTSVPTES